jgi:hypothetical protein
LIEQSIHLACPMSNGIHRIFFERGWSDIGSFYGTGMKAALLFIDMLFRLHRQVYEIVLPYLLPTG